MEEAKVRVREVAAGDDFERIRELMLSTKRRYYNDPRLNVIASEELKDKYIGTSAGKSYGFIAEDDTRLIGFMGVTVAESTRNGYLEYGIEENETASFEALIQASADSLQKNGGQRLYYFASTAFGQIRNQEITLFERQGFISDEYSQIATHLSLRHWKEPDGLNTSGIIPIKDPEMNDIAEMLIEDGEDMPASLFKNQYRDAKQDVVVLSLLGPDNEMAGMVYYKVKRVDPRKADLSAVAFGLHFRPNCAVSKADKKRLLQAALSSMRQLNIRYVTANVTLKNFDTFALMVREGFDDYLANSLRLIKSI